MLYTHLFTALLTLLPAAVSASMLEPYANEEQRPMRPDLLDEDSPLRQYQPISVAPPQTTLMTSTRSVAFPQTTLTTTTRPRRYVVEVLRTTVTREATYVPTPTPADHFALKLAGFAGDSCDQAACATCLWYYHCQLGFVDW